MLRTINLRPCKLYTTKRRFLIELDTRLNLAATISEYQCTDADTNEIWILSGKIYCLAHEELAYMSKMHKTRKGFLIRYTPKSYVMKIVYHYFTKCLDQEETYTVKIAHSKYPDRAHYEVVRASIRQICRKTWSRILLKQFSLENVKYLGFFEYLFFFPCPFPVPWLLHFHSVSIPTLSE